MTHTLEQFNRATAAEAAGMLDGLYEHTPWIAAEAVRQRPFDSLLALQRAMADILAAAAPDAQLALIRAHPELAGKAMVAGELTQESTGDQQAAGLTQCTPAEFARLQQLNTDYNARFGFPFILCVGAGTGMTRAEIIETFAARLGHAADTERAEALRQINRIAALRLAAKFGTQPQLDAGPRA